MLDVRPSPIAGTWYDDHPQRLAAAVDAYLNAADLPPLGGRVTGLMAPHAGHRYSGAVAGYAFAAVRGMTPNLVAVISPMHHPYGQPALTTAHQAYGTPLGIIPVAAEAVAQVSDGLRQRTGFGLTPVSNDSEHALEIELPFLQRALAGEFQLVPIMLRAQDADTARALGAALADALRGRDVLLVASTDLSHYHAQQEAQRLDGAILEAVAAFDPQRLYAAALAGQGEACGLGALAAVMWASRALGAQRAQVLRHATSGDVTGDTSAVVGYAAAVFLA